MYKSFRQAIKIILIVSLISGGVVFAEVKPKPAMPKARISSMTVDTPDGSGFSAFPARPYEAKPKASGGSSHRHNSPPEYAPVYPPKATAGNLEAALANYHSSPGDQFVSGPCWAFAALSGLESLLVKNGADVGAYNFSVRNLMNNHGFASTYAEGGSSGYSIRYFTNWLGPVDESVDPFGSSGSDINSATAGIMPDKVQKHVQDIYFLPDTGDRELVKAEIKDAVMEYGSVITSMRYDDEGVTKGKYYKEATYGYYYYEPVSSYIQAVMSLNHGVLIVGWDDTYSRDNFIKKPDNDGAYIVKNSWGTRYGDGGYFYISYEDTLFPYANYVIANAEEPDNYDNMYFHDDYGQTEFGVFDSTFIEEIKSWIEWDNMLFKNVFKTSAMPEMLKAVSFYTLNDNIEYKIYSENLTLLAEGTTDKQGYHTVVLDTPVFLYPNTDFSVIVNLISNGEPLRIALEGRRDDGKNDGFTAKEGEGFIIFANYLDVYDWLTFEDLFELAIQDVMETFTERNKDGEIVDKAANLCVRAFTDIITELECTSTVLYNDDSALPDPSVPFTGKITFNQAVTRMFGDDDAPVTLVLGLYEKTDGKSKLIGVAEQTKPVTNGAPVNFVAELDVNGLYIGDDAKYELKPFMLRGFESGMPYKMRER